MTTHLVCPTTLKYYYLPCCFLQIIVLFSSSGSICINTASCVLVSCVITYRNSFILYQLQMFLGFHSISTFSLCVWTILPVYAFVIMIILTRLECCCIYCPQSLWPVNHEIHTDHHVIWSLDLTLKDAVWDIKHNKFGTYCTN